MANRIEIVHNSEIDLAKWDRTINEAANSRVYAHSWYLDMVSPDWQGLIWGDYNYIMPLPFGQKYFISYLSQPIYAQQLGVFPVPTAEIIDEMLWFVVKHFNYFRISMNAMNVVQNKLFKIEERRNYILSLNRPYAEIALSFHQNTKRNIRKSAQNISILRTVSAFEYIEMKRKNPGVESNKNYLNSLSLILTTSMRLHKGIIYGAYSPENELCAAAFFLLDSKRAIYLNAVSTKRGKDLCAMYALVDQFIRDNSEKRLLLDFEGSQNQGIARFYESFGAGYEQYQHLYRNTLAWPIRLFKK